MAYLLVAYVVVGAGCGLVTAPITNSAVSGMPRAQAGVAWAAASTSRQIGASFGVPVTGSIVARHRETLDLGRGTGRVSVLLALTRGPMTLRDIAGANGVDAPYATVIVDQLQRRGLVLRTARPDDHRRKLVVQTDAGREAAARVQRILAEPPAALAALPPGDLAGLGEILGRLAPAPVRSQAD